MLARGEERERGRFRKDFELIAPITSLYLEQENHDMSTTDRTLDKSLDQTERDRLAPDSLMLYHPMPLLFNGLQRFAASGGHDFDPERFFSTRVTVQVKEK